MIIKKVIFGFMFEIVEEVDQLYVGIIIVGMYKVSFIKVVEVVKVIENIQCDLNIVLMNELLMIFLCLNIDINEVFVVVGIKWNFLLFKSGLVGGYCIGVDLYYLIYKVQVIGYYLEIILVGC